MVRKQRSVGPSLSVNAVWKGTLACPPQTDGAAFGGADGGVPQGGCSPAKQPLGQRFVPGEQYEAAWSAGHSDRCGLPEWAESEKSLTSPLPTWDPGRVRKRLPSEQTGAQVPLATTS